MARVFLSYDREDAARARLIAQAIERAGHSVWWDFHLKGGAEYGKEIEQALTDADAVVVLWSQRSIQSAWVRDEAAAGRDRGRLIPVRLDDSSPPMGFRQYQNIDLSRWKGRGKPPRLTEILASIVGLSGEQSKTTDPIPASTSLSKLSRTISLALVAALVTAAIAAAYFLIERTGRGNLHTVAIIAADSSARPLARDLLANLGSLSPAQSASFRLVGQDEDDEARPDLIFEATRGIVPGQATAGLVMKSGSDVGVLWSKDFAQPSGSLADLKQQMAMTAGRVLGCAIEGLDAEGAKLDQQTLKLYVNACAEFAETSSDRGQSFIPVFEQVVAKAPRFKAAWAKLLLAEIDSAIPITTVRDFDAGPVHRRLRTDIQNARELDREMPEVRLAEAALLPKMDYSGVLRLLDRAKQDVRDNATVLSHRAAALMRVGRLRSAIEDSKRAAELAPLSARFLTSYALTLAYAGRIDAARAELERAERLWPGTQVVRDAQYNFHWHFGDPKLALELTPPGLPAGREMFLRARDEPSAANIDRFLTFIRAMYSRRGFIGPSRIILQEFAAFHREDELYAEILNPRNNYTGKLDEVLFRPELKTFRADPRFMLVAKKEGLLDYWRKSGKWPDFCFEEELSYDCKQEAAKIAA